MVIKYVKDIMSPFYSIRTNQTVQDAFDEMKRKGIKRIAIVNQNGDLSGVTDSWRLRLVDKDMKIDNAITEKPHIYTITQIVSWDEKVSDIAPKLRDKDVLVVKDEKGKKVGVITRSDLRKLS